MAGTSQASNLSGMLTSIGDTIGEMGGPGKQYVDTLRRTMAPKPDMDNAASLQEYAVWARKNGYDEEADKYMALAYKQKEIEKQEAKDATRAKAVSEATDAYRAGSSGANNGDPLQLQHNIKSLQGQIQRAAQAGDLELVNQLRSDVKS